MSQNHDRFDIGLDSVDWQTLQGQFFLLIPSPAVIARRLDKSRRQVERWRNCEIPLPLHEAFRVARIADNFRLVEAFANDVDRLVIKKPTAAVGKGGASMRTFFELAGDVQTLGKLALKYEIGEPLTAEEREEYHQLCLKIQSLAVAMEQLGKMAERQRNER